MMVVLDFKLILLFVFHFVQLVTAPPVENCKKYYVNHINFNVGFSQQHKSSTCRLGSLRSCCSSLNCRLCGVLMVSRAVVFYQGMFLR